MKHPLQQPTGIRHRIVVLISEMLARFDILCMCIIAFVLQLMMLELNAQQPAFITNGLVAYYPFNGNADDASGNGKNGTLLRGIFISDRFGNSSKALQNSLPVPNWGWAVDTGITSQFSSSFTLSVWFKHASPNDSILIAYGNSGVVDPYIAVVPDLIDYRLRVGKNLSLSDPRISDGNWHLMVATCKNGVASLYFDGNLVKKDSDSTPTAYSGQSWKLAPGPCSLDDVRIYNRALSEAEVKALYDYEFGIGSSGNGVLIPQLKWTSITSEPCQALAISPEGHYFLAKNIGVAKSVDSGGSWQATAYGPPSRDGFNTISLSVNPLGVFVGSLDQGVWRSIDGGATWNNTFGTGFGTGASRMIYHGGTLLMNYGGFLRGVYKWNSSSSGWVQKAGYSPDFSDLEVDNQGAFYACLSGGGDGQGGVFKSTDAGETWVNVIASSFSENPRQILWWNGKLVSIRNDRKLMISSDRGVTWTIHSPFTHLKSGNYVTDMIRGADGQIYASFFGVGVLRTSEPSLSWESYSLGLPSVDIRSLSSDGTNLFAATAGGVSKLIFESVGGFEVVPSGWKSNGQLVSDVREDVTVSGDGSKMLVVGGQGNFFTSQDFAVSWQDTGQQAYGRKVGMSYDGTKMLVHSHWGQLKISTDGGSTWFARGQSGPWQCAAVSPDGTTMAAGNYYGGQMWISRDSGDTWTARGSGGNWLDVAVSVDGKYMIAGRSSGQLQQSSDYGVTWVNGGPAGACSAVAMTPDGRIRYAGIRGGKVFRSTNFGTNWLELDQTGDWTDAACSGDGRIILLSSGTSEQSGFIAQSVDSGASWTTEGNGKYWESISISNDGRKAVASVYTEYIYTNTFDPLSPLAVITFQPQSATLISGATFQLALTATDALTFQWNKDGSALPGATNTTLNFTDFRPAMIGDYTAVVSNAAGSVTSSVASLSIKGVDPGIWKGLVAYYPLDGNAFDKSVFSNQGLGSGITWGLNKFNVGASAAIFDGSGFIQIPDKPQIGSQLTNSMSISFWAKRVDNSLRHITGKRGSSGVWQIFTQGGKGSWGYTVKSGLDFETDWGMWSVESWNFFTTTYDGRVARLYNNGKLVSEKIEIGQIDDTTGIDLLIAGSGIYEKFKGSIDDYRIYNRALSESEVKALYESERVPDTIIINQPQALSLAAGAKATFSVTATNSSPLVSLTYQWQKDGNPVPGATNSLLTITNVQPVNIGDYNVIVSGGFQAVTSASASLRIEGVNSGIWKGLVAYYPFNGNAKDESGNNVNGVIKGVGSYVKGGVSSGNSLMLDGLSGYVESSLVQIKKYITVSGWVKYNRSTQWPAHGIAAQGLDRETSMDWTVSLSQNPSCRLRPHITVNGSWVYFDCNTMIKPDEWCHVMMVYDGIALKGYVNGVLDGSISAPGDFQTTVSDLRIGAYAPVNGTGSKCYFPGNLSLIRIYNRALSDTEVKSLYESEQFPDTVISAQPVSLIVPLGGTAQLSVTATNPIPTVQFAYQWFKDGTKLVGATNFNLNLGQLRLEQIGTYSVTVDDRVRKFTSTEANVALQGVDSSIWKGLIASYSMDGNFEDSTGFGDSLIPFGPVNFVDQGRRPETKAARVSGGDGFLVGSDHAWFSGPEPRTVSVWIKPEVISTNVSTVVALGSLENCGQRFSLQVPSAQNGIRFDGGDCAVGLRSKTFTGSSLSGKWTHAVLTYDGTSVRCYVNSLASGSGYAVDLITDSTAPLVLGNAVGLDGEGFIGMIDDVRIYNRSLSAVEVRSLYLYESSGVAPSLPQITRQPAAVSGYEGETLKLSVEASGYQLGYQWQKGGQNLSVDLRLQGVSTSELQIKGAKIDDIGDYRVLVTNVYGWVASTTVKVAVVPPVRSLVAGLASEVQEGQRMTFPLSMVSTGDVGGLTFKLNYNSAFLTDPKVEWSALVGQSVNTVNTLVVGEVSGSFSLAGIALPSGIVGLGTVNFRARSVPMLTNAVLSPVIVSVGTPNGGSLTSGNGAIAGEGRIRPRRIKGDNNANQRVDIGDATVISRLLVALEEVRVWDVQLNDLNNTGDLDNGDVIKSLRTVVGLDPQPGPMGDAKRLSVALALEPTPMSTHYSAELALLDGPTIQIGRPYRVAVTLKAGQGDLTGLSFSLKYPASLELKEKAIAAGVPTDALPAWNVSGNRAKLAVIRPKAWAAHSGTVAVFTFEAKPEAAKQVTLPILLEDLEVADVDEGLSAMPSVWLEIGEGLQPAPQLRVMHGAGGTLTLEIRAPQGLLMALETSEDLSAWNEVQKVSGQGEDSPVKVTVEPEPQVQGKFWRMRIL